MSKAPQTPSAAAALKIEVACDTPHCRRAERVRGAIYMEMGVRDEPRWYLCVACWLEGLCAAPQDARAARVLVT